LPTIDFQMVIHVDN